MTEQFCVSTDAPCVQGHFPGMPLVPGAWLLGRVHAAVQSRFPGYRLASLNKAKFLSPLLPEQHASICVDDSRWPRLQVSVQRQDEQGEAVPVLTAVLVLEAL